MKYAGFLTAATLAMAVGTLTAIAGPLDDIKAKGEFVYGLEAQYKPFEFRDEANAIIGYDVDIANEIGKRIGVKAKPMDTNWATVIQSLYNGEFDIIIGGMTATQKRYERVNFSLPYMDASSGLLVKADSGIAGPKDLAGKSVAAGAGTPQIQQLLLSAKEQGIAYAGDVKSYDNDAVAYEAFNAGRIDAYASTIVSLLEFVKTHPAYKVIPFTSKEWAREWTAMAFTKEADDFRAEVDKQLVAMKADGTLKALQDKWFGMSFVDVLPETPPTW